MNQEEILRQLADKKITREEAEKMLAELDAPAPKEPRRDMQDAPKKSSSSAGCLIAVIIVGILAFLAIPFFIFLFMWGESSKAVYHEEIHLHPTEILESIEEHHGHDHDFFEHDHGHDHEHVHEHIGEF